MNHYTIGAVLNVLIESQPVLAPSPYYYWLGGEAKNTKFITNISFLKKVLESHLLLNGKK
jgi:hypothetical protein